MPKKVKHRIIIDTNIWISFLIGRRFRLLKKLIVEKKVEIILSEQILTEIRTVTSRPTFIQYFGSIEVDKLINFLKYVGKMVDIKTEIKKCRDPKDDFLLSLAIDSQADFLITGDKDLLDIKKIANTKIVTYSAYQKIV